MAFVNLHAHDHGSLLDGIGTPEQRVEVAKKLKQPALSITNHGNLITVPDHIKACKSAGIQPIVGIEAYFKPDRFKQDTQHKKNWHLILIAKNQKGFQNLIKLSSEGHTTGFYYKPCIDYALMEKYGEGLICCSACISGYLPSLITDGKENEIHDCIQQHLNIFGEDNYRFEIMPHRVPAQKTVNLVLSDLSLKYGIPLVATNDSHYPFKSWKDTQDIVLMISTGQSRKQRVKKRDAGEEVYEIDVPLHMFSEDEMRELFAKNHPDLKKSIVNQALKESINIAEQIEDVDIDRSPKTPRITKSSEQANNLLRKLCESRLKELKLNDDNKYTERLETELQVIKDFEVADYFLLVAKMVKWARGKGIRISSGRGSAAGSLVCYLSNITTIDPIGHNLLFERFMNPDRKGLPDIDLDFEHERRDEVKAWLAKEYGSDKVVDIGSFGTYHPKGALKDVARVLDVPFSKINTVTKVIPDASDVGGQGNVPPLRKLKEENGFLEKFAQDYPEVWKHALRIEGQIKQLSKHAAGVVVTDTPLTDFLPLLHGKSGIVTSWSSRAENDVISEMNLTKIDVLSLDGLTKQGNTVRMIQERTGKRIDLDKLPVATDPKAIDPEVLKLFQKGLTLGVFQFGGGRGIMNFLKRVKPDRFEDLVAVNALYRPGALEGGDAFKYGDVKTGKEPIEYWHEAVIPHLKETYGILVFQEQLQQIAQSLGNFSPGESDDMRKATSKLYRMGKEKAREFMAGYHDTWMKGCADHGLDQEKAEYIWQRMIAMGAYTFNKSHSSSYSLVAYQDGWLKTYYPEAFYASLLTNEEIEKAEEIIRESKQLGIKILPPDINQSDAEFKIVDGKLLYGLESVKYVGYEAVNEILRERPFSSYDDFVQKVRKKKVNKRVKESLAKAGAFDNFGLRDGLSIGEKRNRELEVLGVALSGATDIETFSDIIKTRSNSEEQFDKMPEGAGLTVAGEIFSIKEIKIKNGPNKGKPMGFVNIGYESNQFECTLFSEKYKKYKDKLSTGCVIFVKGRKSDRGQVLVDGLIEAEKLAEAIK